MVQAVIMGFEPKQQIPPPHSEAELPVIITFRRLGLEETQKIPPPKLAEKPFVSVKPDKTAVESSPLLKITTLSLLFPSIIVEAI